MIDPPVLFDELYAEPSRNGLTKPKRVRGSGVKMVNMGEIFAHGRIANLSMDRVPLTASERTSLLRAGDLLFARQSLVLSGAGKCAIFMGDEEDVCFESHIIRVRVDPRKANAFYLYYLFQSPLGRAAIESIVEQGAGVAGIRASDLAKLRLPVLPRGRQDDVASVLCSLDDKIESNQRLNLTLEAMAQVMFRDWFVDFGPVRRKLNGERDPVAILGGLTPDPARAAELVALFPDALGDDGIPTGWGQVPLLTMARLVSGGTPKTDISEYWGGSIAWASAKDVSQCGQTFLLGTERTITDLGLAKSATRMVPALATVVVARGATTGRYCMLGTEMAMNQTCYALVSNAEMPFWLNLAFGAEVERLVQAAHGSVFDTITTRTLETAQVISGSAEVVGAFESVIAPLFQRILLALQENATLTETRDYVLPRLMSGKVRVADVADEAVA